MKRVVIGMERGKPVILSCPKNVEVIIKTQKRKTFKKVFRTWVYRVRTLGQ